MKQTACLVGFALALACIAPSIGRAQCVGDCNGDGRVTIAELILNVNNFLYGETSPPSCPNGDRCPSPPGIVVNCLVEMVNNALNGCP